MLVNSIDTKTLPRSQQALVSGSAIFITSFLHSNLSLVYRQFTSLLQAAGLHHEKLVMKFARVHKTEKQHTATRNLSPFPQEVWESDPCRTGMRAVHLESLCLYGEYMSCLKNPYWRNDRGTRPTHHYFFIDNTSICFLNWKNDNLVLFPISSWKLAHLDFWRIHVKCDNKRTPMGI